MSEELDAAKAKYLAARANRDEAVVKIAALKQTLKDTQRALEDMHNATPSPWDVLVDAEQSLLEIISKESK